MLKKTIKYVDYNGVEQKEDFYFNLTKAELAEMELEFDGGLTSHIKHIVDTKDTKELIKIFKDIILRSYGVKSEDGKRFIKSEKLVEEFKQTEAYSVLFMELTTSDESAANFIKSIIPAELSKQIPQELPSKEA